MEKSRFKAERLIRRAWLAVAWALTCMLAACAYRLPPSTLPSQQRLNLVTDSLDVPFLRLRIVESRDYRVPKDGRVTLDVPGYRAACSVYLFNKIRVQRGADPFEARTLDVIVGGKTVAQLSLKEIAALPVDGEGYHLLAIRTAK